MEFWDSLRRLAYLSVSQIIDFGVVMMNTVYGRKVYSLRVGPKEILTMIGMQKMSKFSEISKLKKLPVIHVNKLLTIPYFIVLISCKADFAVRDPRS